MKKLATLTIIVLVALALAVPAPAYAKDWSKGEKNVSKVVIAPFRILGKAWSNVCKTATMKEPKAVCNIFKETRQEAVDVGETVLYRLPAGKEAIAEDGVGTANTKVTEAGLDWLVDGVIYGVGTGVLVWNEAGPMTWEALNQAWIAGASAGVGAVAADLIVGDSDD
jgi:hypothetical protein